MAKSTYDLTRRLTVQQNTLAGTMDGNGNPAEDWDTVCTVYAQKTGLKGRLFYAAAAAQKEDDVMFVTYYRADITAAMRIIDGPEIFEIKVPPVDEDGTRMWMQLHCRAVLQNGT
jgi:SPP1 family predicted phage head-tail adaptor